MKKHSKNRVDENDRFYKLDDDLLRHLIDFLPVRDALRTSVLSSRWRYLWRSISNIRLLGFNIRSKHHESSFLDSMDRLLVHHDNSDIKRFLAWNVRMNAARFHLWISEVIKRHVHELLIDYSTCCVSFVEPCILPVSLFKCESLTCLEINMGINSIILGSGGSSLFSVYLPCLKRLKLSKAVFLNNHSTQQLFTNIPKLQQLFLYRCNWENVDDHLIINIPTLEEVDVQFEGSRSRNRNRGCQVTIIAPKLTSFKCETDFYMDFLLSNYYSLSLDVILNVVHILNYGARLAAIRLLQSVKKLLSLHMTWAFNKWLNLQNIALKELPIFINLKHLEISKDYCTFGDANLKKTLMFLHNMPNLESLTILLPERNYQEWEDWSDDDAPSCVIHGIKKVNISSKTGNCSYAMGLTRYLMNYSLSLETLEVIWLSYSPDPLQDFTDEIKRHPRYSQLKIFSCSTNILFPPPWNFSVSN